MTVDIFISIDMDFGCTHFQSNVCAGMSIMAYLIKMINACVGL